MARTGARTWLLRAAGVQAWRTKGERNLRAFLEIEKQRGVATLAYDEILVPGQPLEGMRTVMFMHGLLGSGRNWRSFAKVLGYRALQESPPNFPGYRFILVDLRNHGKSASLEGFGPPHDMAAAARDVVELVKANSWGWPDIILGHSMGGKVALEFSQQIASGHYEDVVSPKQLWLLDSIPGKVPSRDSQGEVEQLLATIQSLPDPLPSRRWLVDQMTKLGFSKTLSDWLGSNLKKVELESSWRVNLEMTWIFKPKESHEMFLSFCKSDYWSILEAPPEGMEIGIVRASRSRWTPDVIRKLEILTSAENANGKVAYHILENAGHWLHVDNPEGLANILCPYLTKLSM